MGVVAWLLETLLAVSLVAFTTAVGAYILKTILDLWEDKDGRGKT